LLEDLAERVSGEEDLPWRMAVTTFFHVHEVQDTLRVIIHTLQEVAEWCKTPANRH
jgi:hypothetical protein